MHRFAVIFVFAIAVGCGGKPDVPLSPVRGQVFFQNRPAAGALVVFHPVGADVKVRPRGYVEQDGGFQLTTESKHDGAPAGEYRVTIVWRKQVDEDEDAGPNLLPRQYGLPSRTPLRARVGDSPTKLDAFRIESN